MNKSSATGVKLSPGAEVRQEDGFDVFEGRCFLNDLVKMYMAPAIASSGLHNGTAHCSLTTCVSSTCGYLTPPMSWNGSCQIQD